MMKLFYLVVAIMAIQSIHCARIKLKCKQIKAFVDIHNKLRQKVAAGKVPNQPPASDMQTILWDDDLAEKAGKWAERGEFGHNPDTSIKSKPFDSTGENIYMAMSPSADKIRKVISDAVNAWFDEYKNHEYEPFSMEKLMKVGHYTQVAWAKTNRVGCGIDQREDGGMIKTFVVCNYGPPGNYLGELPYKKSSSKGSLICDGDCSKLYGNKC
nr:venom protein U-MPTX.10-Mc15 [Megalopyge crispata]